MRIRHFLSVRSWGCPGAAPKSMITKILIFPWIYFLDFLRYSVPQTGNLALDLSQTTYDEDNLASFDMTSSRGLHLASFCLKNSRSILEILSAIISPRPQTFLLSQKIEKRWALLGKPNILLPSTDNLERVSYDSRSFVHWFLRWKCENTFDFGTNFRVSSPSPPQPPIYQGKFKM